MKKITAHEEEWALQTLLEDDGQITSAIELPSARGYSKLRISSVHRLVNSEILEEVRLSSRSFIK